MLGTSSVQAHGLDDGRSEWSRAARALPTGGQAAPHRAGALVMGQPGRGGGGEQGLARDRLVHDTTGHQTSEAPCGQVQAVQ